MLRNIVKIFAYGVICLDILYVFTLDPKIAIGRILFLALVIWAWRLY